MTNLDINFVNLLNKGKSLHDIKHILGISYDKMLDILKRLKTDVLLFSSLYNYDSNIEFTNFYSLFDNNNTYVNKELLDNKIRLMLISDLHLGNVNDSIIATDLMYDYCIKNNINIVLNLGDFFEGAYKNKVNKFEKFDKQIEYALNKYPYDKNIYNFLVLGNHDVSLILDEKIDLKKIINEKRKDIIVTGIGRSNLFLNNFHFRMDHEVSRIKVDPVSKFENGIILKGHSHKYKVIVSDQSMVIYVPSLSNVVTNQLCSFFPDMIDMTIRINNNYIDYIILSHYIIYDNKIILMGEQKYSILIKDNDHYLDDIYIREKKKI